MHLCECNPRNSTVGIQPREFNLGSSTQKYNIWLHTRHKKRIISCCNFRRPPCHEKIFIFRSKAERKILFYLHENLIAFGTTTPSSLLSSLISVFSPRFLASTRWWSFQPHFLLPLPPLPPPLPLPLQRIPPSTWMRWSEDLISGALRYSHTVNKTACIPSDNATRFSSLLPPPSSLLHLPLSPATEEGSTLNSAPLPQLLPHGR